MEFLLSRKPPIKKQNRTFSECFESMLVKSDHIKIASGFVSAEALTELKKIIEMNSGPKLDFMIGMHYFEGITRPQYESAKYLDDFLHSRNIGSITIAKTFKFHGKLYSFLKEGKPIASILGSSNISSMLGAHRNFESDLFLDESNVKIVTEISDFITKISDGISDPISSWVPERFIENNFLFEDHERVEKVVKEEHVKILDSRIDIEFDIPLKTTPKSNLNAYFGKGRENRNTGFTKPRHWYEVELIVSKAITQDPNYPKSGDKFTVYTDDNWKFDCKISGDYSKNFRSYGDLTILGKWIKGRLENSGVLEIGKPVTEKVLEKYGRKSFKLTATNDPQTWILDFSTN